MVAALSGAFALLLVLTSGLWLNQEPDLTTALAEQQAPQEEGVADNAGARNEQDRTEQDAADVRATPAEGEGKSQREPRAGRRSARCPLLHRTRVSAGATRPLALTY